MEYKLVISGPIGAGKSTLLESITQYLRMHDYKVGCVREFIDSHSDGSKKLADWISCPKPICAPVNSAAIKVASAADMPSLIPTKIYGTAAGTTTFRKILKSLNPNTFAALISVTSTLTTP